MVRISECGGTTGSRGRSHSSRSRCRVDAESASSDLLNANGSWKLELLQQYFLPAAMNEILKIRASPRLEEDVIAWDPRRHGIFTIKFAYHFAFQEVYGANTASSSTSISGGRSYWRFIWKCGVRPMIHHCAW